MVEYLPGIIAYFCGGFLIWASKVFIWKIANHWSKIWVADYWKNIADYDASQANAQTLSLSVMVTAFIVFGIAVAIWSVANHINYKNTERGIAASFAGGIGIATGVGAQMWLNEIATKWTTYPE